MSKAVSMSRKKKDNLPPTPQGKHFDQSIDGVDEQTRALEDLRESEARFRAMFESSAMGVVILDMKTLSLRYNAVARGILDDAELPSVLADPYELIHVRYREAEQALFAELLSGQRDSYTTDRHYHRPGEESTWSHVTISAVKGSQRELCYIVGTIENVTQQKKSQQQLRDSEARFRAMFDNTSVGIALTDLDRHILQVNEAAARITGYSLDELTRMNPIDLAVPDDRELAQSTLQEMVTGKRDNMTVERRYMRKNGEIFWGRVTYSLVRGPDYQPLYLIGLIEDINEQKVAAEKLADQKAQYLAMLEQRVEERTRELSQANLRLVSEIEQRQRVEEALATKAVEEAIMAERTRLARDLHDAVTQTLFSASLIAEVLPELWGVDPDEARKSNEELRELTRGALAEMRTLLLELRPAALTQAPFPDLLKQLSEAVIGRARLSVRLTVEGDYELTPDVKVVFYRIAQESLNNIVKYARATQVEIHIRLDCCNVHMEINDNGIGFDSAAVKPTSLGMRIMRERAEAIHADLWVSSLPGQGTTISLDWNEDEITPISTHLMRG
jgi:PAS domain S-box-containing protein